ncbi:MAG TPA: glycine zipper 2TM domain-containing protein [Stellaceae bacterium]|jgi:outer membrane lipoprotein SlyB|nr:glycine zipper 2TM domain-containing protein [Stellaceae bacterium]
MSPKILIAGAALLGLAGCVSAPYSPDTGYSQGYPAQTYYYQAPGYYYSPGGYVAEAPAPGYACGSGTAVGALGGAAAGGLIGSQFGHGSGNAAATIGGVAAGAVVGGSLGNNYDRAAGC